MCVCVCTFSLSPFACTYLCVNLTNEQATCGKSEAAAVKRGKNRIYHILFTNVGIEHRLSVSVCLCACESFSYSLSFSFIYRAHCVCRLIDWFPCVFDWCTFVRIQCTHSLTRAREYLYTFVWYNSIESMHLTCRAYFSSNAICEWNICDIRYLIPRILALGYDARPRPRTRSILTLAYLSICWRTDK